MSELKPCPFCGGDPRIDTEYDMDGFGNFHKVECRKCGASSKAHFCTQGNECHQYYQEVREDWNTRATDSQITKLEADNAELKEKNSKLMFIIENGLGIDDLQGGNIEDVR